MFLSYPYEINGRLAWRMHPEGCCRVSLVRTFTKGDVFRAGHMLRHM